MHVISRTWQIGSMRPSLHLHRTRNSCSIRAKSDVYTSSICYPFAIKYAPPVSCWAWDAAENSYCHAHARAQSATACGTPVNHFRYSVPIDFRKTSVSITYTVHVPTDGRAHSRRCHTTISLESVNHQQTRCIHVKGLPLVLSLSRIHGSRQPDASTLMSHRAFCHCLFSLFFSCFSPIAPSS